MQKRNKQNIPTTNDFVEKVKEGLRLTHQKLLIDKAREDKELVFAKPDGTIYTVKAKELLEKEKNSSCWTEDNFFNK